MKVAVDIDGTISERPEFFAVLSVALRAAGHLIVVLTYRDPARAEATRAQLAAWGVEFDELVIAAHGVDLFFDDHSGLEVGPLALGGNVFGWTANGSTTSKPSTHSLRPDSPCHCRTRHGAR